MPGSDRDGSAEVFRTLQRDCDVHDLQTLQKERPPYDPSLLRARLVHYLARRVEGGTISFMSVKGYMQQFLGCSDFEREAFVDRVTRTRRERRRHAKIQARRDAEED